MGISPRLLIDHTRVVGTASRSATSTAVINRRPVSISSGRPVSGRLIWLRSRGMFEVRYDIVIVLIVIRAISSIETRSTEI